MTTLKDIQDYNENLARKHTDLQHEVDGRVSFGRYKDEAIIDELTKSLNQHCVLVSSVNGQRTGDIDERKFRWGMSFMFISKASLEGSRAYAIDAAHDKALEILFDFLNKWEEDQQNDCEVLQAFVLSEASIDEIDSPWLDNFYGWFLFIPYNTRIPCANNNKWIN